MIRNRAGQQPKQPTKEQQQAAEIDSLKKENSALQKAQVQYKTSVQEQANKLLKLEAENGALKAKNTALLESEVKHQAAAEGHAAKAAALIQKEAEQNLAATKQVSRTLEISIEASRLMTITAAQNTREQDLTARVEALQQQQAEFARQQAEVADARSAAAKWQSSLGERGEALNAREDALDQMAAAQTATAEKQTTKAAKLAVISAKLSELSAQAERASEGIVLVGEEKQISKDDIDKLFKNLDDETVASDVVAEAQTSAQPAAAAAAEEPSEDGGVASASVIEEAESVSITVNSLVPTNELAGVGEQVAAALTTAITDEAASTSLSPTSERDTTPTAASGKQISTPTDSAADIKEAGAAPAAAPSTSALYNALSMVTAPVSGLMSIFRSKSTTDTPTSKSAAGTPADSPAPVAAAPATAASEEPASAAPNSTGSDGVTVEPTTPAAAEPEAVQLIAVDAAVIS